MKTFWLFRSNLLTEEYYHKYKDLETFEKNCHDFYMLFPLWLLRNTDYHQVIVWRLTDKPRPDILFTVNGKHYFQKWITGLEQTFFYPSPTISFWRGGFKEYDKVTKDNPVKYGLKLYLAAGRRITPQYGGKYDVILMEDERDIREINHLPFYKTASKDIFYPNGGKEKKIDILFPSNFAQLKYKGQEDFIRCVSENNFLCRMKIVHCGNNPEVGSKLCNHYGVKNIEFLGNVDRTKLNSLLQESFFGLNFSNVLDGCPRTSTEILMSGTPLIIHERTRLLKYYKNEGVIVVNEKNIVDKIKSALHDYTKLEIETRSVISNELSMESVMKKNLDIWEKVMGERAISK
jgi:hypothetical protein